MREINAKMRAHLSSVSTPKMYASWVDRHLASGGSPNVYSREHQHFHSILGLACHKSNPDVVVDLLAAGAAVHWPQSTMPTKRLTGDPEEEYAGLPLDPLGICLDNIGWECKDQQEQDNCVDGFKGGIAPRLEIARLLLVHGADPTRKDPAFGTLPMDAIMRYMMEHTSGNIVPEVEMVFINLVMEAAKNRPDNGSLVAMSDGNWSDVSWMEVRWQDHYPQTDLKIQAMAQQLVLSAAVPSVNGLRRVRL